MVSEHPSEVAHSESAVTALITSITIVGTGLNVCCATGAVQLNLSVCLLSVCMDVRMYVCAMCACARTCAHLDHELARESGLAGGRGPSDQHQLGVLALRDLVRDVDDLLLLRHTETWEEIE